MSKVDIARKIFNQYYSIWARKDIIEEMVYRAGLTQAGASTYYQKFKKERDDATAGKDYEARRRKEQEKAREDSTRRQNKAKEDYEAFQRAFNNAWSHFSRQQNNYQQTEVKIEKPQSWYIVLGVDSNASAAEIKSAYRKKAMSAHPDVVGGSLDLMQKINAAYDLAKKLKNFK